VVVATIFFSGISGSKLAEAGAMGVAIFPRMAAAKYPAPLSVGIVASASAMGEMVPPAILMIVLATLANQSVAQLFAACLLPALVMAFCLMAQILMEARRLGLPRVHFSLARLGVTLFKALPALVVPVVVIGGLVTGFMTATEGGAVAVILVLGIAFIYRELRMKDLPMLLLSSARTSGSVLFLVAIATILSFVLALLGVPQAMVSLFLQITTSAFVFMFLSAVILILFGSALESVPAALIFLPVFLPVTDTLGISTIQYLVVVVGALGIGLFLPPLGVGSIMLSGIAGVPAGQGARQVAWLLISIAVALILIMLIPAMSLMLPFAVTR
jgi:C4-dicarboxylate transporter DctM subunit